MDGIRAVIAQMEPYVWEEPSEAIAKRYGLKGEVARFDMNTAPYVLQSVREAAELLKAMPFNEYPMPSYGRLTRLIAAYSGVQADQVAVGAGADEVIDFIAKTFLDAGDKSVVSTPTYSMFRISSIMCGAKVVEVPRRENYALDADALADASKNAKLLWVCNPNSPTGNAESIGKIRQLVEAAKCTVVVDEAYFEFWGQTASKLVEEFDNLIVVRTLSKAFGLAGARVGYAVCNPALAAVLNKARLPCSISLTSSALAEAALSAEGILEMRANAYEVNKQREGLAAELGRLGLICFPSAANFILADFCAYDARAVFKKLLFRGLVVRDCSGRLETRNCLRITVGSCYQNALLASALRDALK